MPLVLGATIGLVLLVAIVFGGALGVLSSDGNEPGCQAGAPSGQQAVADIPASYLALYRKAGAEYQIPWPVLAAIGDVESDHGRQADPGARSGADSARAKGPMNLLASTWHAYQVDGDRDGKKDVYDPADAITTAANYLKAKGAPEHLLTAIRHYNHSGSYGTKILDRAKEYAASQGPEQESASEQCATAVALPPSSIAAKVIAYAHAQLGKPYAWGREGPSSFDCSGLTWAAYRSAGITIPRVSADQWQHTPHVPHGQEQPGDLAFFNSGPNTSPDRPGHVGIVIGDGKMIAAPHTGTVVQVQPYTRQSLIGFTRPSSIRR
jgi:cell wall-associated NlpC family hydrolase